MTPAELLTMRQDAGLSQQALANLLGVHVVTVSRWERGVRAIPPYLQPACATLIARKERELRERCAD